MKKYFFYFLVILFNFFLIEALSLFIIKEINSKYLSKIEFKNKYQKHKHIPYLRDKNQYDGETYIKLKNENNLLFNELNSFNSKNFNNILIQGDSWGESLNMLDIHEFYSKKLKENKIGLINSSISSYSITPYIFQLELLQNEYLVEPEVIILLYDQTDIGDDLYRYNFFLNNKQYEKFLFYEEKLLEDLKKKNLNSIQVMLFFKNYFQKQKSRYQYSNLQTFKYLIKTIYLNKFQKTPIALVPLKYGINKKEKDMLIALLNNYINKAFNNKKLKKLYFVVHPHFNHINKHYILDNREILDNAIYQSLYKEKIEVINFFDEKKELYSFYNEDAFSHPTKKYYKNVFWSKIFNEILN